MRHHPVPLASDHLPESLNETGRALGIRLVVMGIALVLRRATGHWPTTCQVLHELAQLGVDLDRTDGTPEAVVWLDNAQLDDEIDTSPWGVLVWDEGADGLVRVVAPAAVQEEMETWLASGES